MRSTDSEHWHLKESPAVLVALETSLTHGLHDEQVLQRQQRYGRNELSQDTSRSPWRILREQFSSSMTAVLFAAAALSAMLRDLKDAVAICTILILNATLGFLQDYRADRAIAALRKLAVHTVRVRRNAGICDVPAPDIVPGDMIYLEAGTVIPADCRVIESLTLQAQEASLTGESIPVDKTEGAIEDLHAPLGDRRNMLYAGTSVTYGRGVAVVTAIGMSTELGRIANLVQSIKTELTPLQRRLDHFATRVAFVILAIVLLVLVAELARGTELRLVMLTAISMAVAAVPEGLPAVVTIALALGAQRMLKQRALIRKLPAVETLGSVTVVCSDKTGTLTENRMTATSIIAGGQHFKLAKGAAMPPPGQFLLVCVALCNDAFVETAADGIHNQLSGDPTEVALIDAAFQSHLDKRRLDALFPRINEIPFSSERRLMTTIHEIDKAAIDQIDLGIYRHLLSAQRIAITKGAVDRILSLCETTLVGDTIAELTEDSRKSILASQDKFASDGMRVLGVAYRLLEESDSQTDVESSMVFLGVIAMIDPPRAMAKEAVLICKDAGIRPIMITGDHPLTALSIARELGITGNDLVVTGFQLDLLSDAELKETLETASVFARVSPEHKLTIVGALQAQGHIVAMTGDGVNDAPALKKADIGVAMGKGGTDVAKESADMILLDDNFETIVSAVREGRVIHDNIRKFIKYLLTTNYAEIFVMVVAPFLGMPLPLLPLQILWINLLTDGPPALALGVEPAETTVMKNTPRDPKVSILADGIAMHIAWVGTLMGSISIGIGYWYWIVNSGHWQTMVFLTLTLCQLAHVLAIRSGTASLLQGRVLSNQYMIWAVGGVFLLQLAAIYHPALQAVFGTVSVPALDFGIATLGAVLIFIAVEVEKWARRASSAPPGNPITGEELA